MSALVLYHNPICSKSCVARELLATQGRDVVVRDYVRDPLDAEELRLLLLALNRPACDLVRFGDAARALGLADTDARSEAEWIQWLVSHPALLQRPILARGDRAVIARPPERIMELL